MTQTDTVNSLKRYLGIEEKKIPCLVYIPIYKNTRLGQNIVVPFPEGEVDLYRYFKNIMGEISPKIMELCQNCNDNGAEYYPRKITESIWFREIENVFQKTDIPTITEGNENSITIGNNNTIKNSHIIINS